MRKLEFDGIIGAVEKKTKSTILRVGSESREKKEDGTYESKTEWIHCILGLDAAEKHSVGDRYFFRGDLRVSAYESKKEPGAVKAQMTVFITENPICLYRKKSANGGEE